MSTGGSETLHKLVDRLFNVESSSYASIPNPSALGKLFYVSIQSKRLATYCPCPNTTKMSDDWACEGCTFINSGYLRSCELCSAPRFVTGQEPGPSGATNDAIVLSDDDDDDHVRRKGFIRDFVNLTDDNVHEQAPRTAPQPTLPTSRRQRDAKTDVTIIYDDDADCLLIPPPQPNLPPSTCPAPSSSRGSFERFTLDACNCTHTVCTLATLIGPVLSRATTTPEPAGRLPQPAIQSAPAGPSRGTLTQPGTSGVIHPAQPARAPTATLYDLTAPLVCPTVKCGTWFSSRDVRLLLGPYGTDTLYHAMHTALKQEAKTAKALQRAMGHGVGGASAAVGTMPPAAEAKDAPARGGRGGVGRHRHRRGAHGQEDEDGQEVTSAPAAPAAASAASSTLPAATAPPQLQPLAPSCPSCRARMTPTAVLAQPQNPHPQHMLQTQQHRDHSEVLPAPPKLPSRSRRKRSLDAGAAAAGPSAAAAAAANAGAADPSPDVPCAARLQPAQLENALRALAARGSAVQVVGGGGSGGSANGILTASGRGSGGGGVSDPLQPLCERLLQLVGPNCVFVCLACGTTLEEGAVLPQRTRQDLQRKAQLAAEALLLLRRLRAVLLSVHEDEEGEEGAAEAAAGTRDGASPSDRKAAGAASSKKRARSHAGGGSGCGSSKAWAKGVGYGGGDWRGGASHSVDAEARKKAQERQRQADMEVRNCLTTLMDLLSSCHTSRSGAAAGGSNSGGGEAALSSPPPVLLAALQYGGLPYVLRLLLQNDSLLDMGQRQDLYGVVLSVVRRCLSSMALLELLMVRAADPGDISAPPPTGPIATAPEAGGAGATTDPPLCTVFESLARQCAVFKRSAQELADGAEEDIAALGLALELSAVAEEVAAGSRMWQHGMGAAQGILQDHIQLPAGPVTTTGTPTTTNADLHDASTEARRAKRRKQRHDGAAEDAAVPSGSGAGANAGGATMAGGMAAAGGAGPSNGGPTAESGRRSQYLSSMRPLQFREVNLMEDHYFRSEVSESSRSAAGGEVMRQRLKRITGEISSLATGLPLEWDAAAFVAVDENRVDVLRALLIPASDTPYANGPFIFDIYLPPNYPNLPPKVQFLTTGGGRVRFNPNLYAQGKVCLSLLGTWSGPSWDPAMSTVLQVLVSIHSMILVNDPYFNEPGWESQAGTAAGRQAASDYANSQRYNTLAFAILPALQMLVKGQKSLSGGNVFHDVLRTHFKLKATELVAQCDTWLAGIAAAAAAPRPTAPGVYSFPSAASIPSSAPGMPLPSLSMHTESSQEQLKRHTETVVPQIKELLGML